VVRRRSSFSRGAQTAESVTPQFAYFLLQLVEIRFLLSQSDLHARRLFRCDPCGVFGSRQALIQPGENVLYLGFFLAQERPKFEMPLLVRDGRRRLANAFSLL
jgi:hypothetical protein